MSSEYGADQIQALEGLMPVRLRPGMYIGSTGKEGYHHLLWEVVDNSVDEVMGGFATKVSVTINEDSSITVKDDGRGIPVEPQKSGSYKGMPTVEMVMTVLHAGGKFGDGAYTFSGGLHGVGISVVNALSEWVHVDVTRDEAIHHIEFGATTQVIDGQEKVIPGVVTKPLSVIGTAKSGVSGTSVTFLPDASVFSTTGWDYDVISRRLLQSAYLNPVLTFTLTDLREGADHTPETYHYPNGLLDFMESITTTRLADTENVGRTDLLLPETPIRLGGSDPENGGSWDMCFRWFADGGTYKVRSFANGIVTGFGGTHVTGYERQLTAIMNKYARQDHISMLGDRESSLEASDVRSGLQVILSVKVRDPQFVGQTKDQLSNRETGQMVSQGFAEKFWDWMQEHPTETKVILSRMIDEMRLRRKLAEQAKNARDQMESKGIAAKSLPLPEKLTDCTTRKREDAELFIVEGDSAGGTVKRIRDRETQALLPIRGKILNIETSREEQVENNKEVQSIIAAIGAGSRDLFDVDSSRYGKVIILTDADSDGKHIQCLLMLFFIRFMRPLVEAGHLYVSRPPLFSVDAGKKGKFYVYTIAERDKLLEKYPNSRAGRFKGLGEMEADELQETSINPETRSLAQITIEDIDEALLTASSLMGGDSTPKWELISGHEMDMADATSA